MQAQTLRVRSTSDVPEGWGLTQARLALDASLSKIVSRLMTRFSSKEGYVAFDDAIPTSTQPHFCGDPASH